MSDKREENWTPGAVIASVKNVEENQACYMLKTGGAYNWPRNKNDFSQKCLASFRIVP